MTDEQLKSPLPAVPEVVTEEEWSSWLGHPTTKVFREFLRKQVAETTDHWVTGKFTGPTGFDSLQMNSRAIGECQAWKDILSLSAQDINEGMYDE